MFASDNAAPAHPAILEAIARANTGIASSYGADDWTRRAEAALRETFETDCTVLLVATGTAANALSLASLTPPWGGVIAHKHAHIVEDEAGAPEFYMGGAKLLLLVGDHGKIDPETLKREAGKHSRQWVHGAQPFAVSISQASETGAVYTPAEIAALSEICRAGTLKLHMDGARFANAVASTGASPAELSWKAGVDVLSFGATKNGALCVEAIVCFDPAAAAQLPHLRKRAGHLFSKHRVLGAQMAAYLEDGLWLELARHANARAHELADVLVQAGGALAHPVEANEAFVRLDERLASALRSAGAAFHNWATDGADVYRFVASWATSEADIEACRRALAKV